MAALVSVYEPFVPAPYIAAKTVLEDKYWKEIVSVHITHGRDA